MQDQYKLKLELMYNGINIEEKYLQMLNTKNYLNKEYITTSGLILNYTDTYVNTPINPQSKYQLIYDDSWKIIVKSKTIVSDINLLLPPKYALNKEKLEDGFDEKQSIKKGAYKYSCIYNERICQIIDGKFVVLK